MRMIFLLKAKYNFRSKTTGNKRGPLIMKKEIGAPPWLRL